MVEGLSKAQPDTNKTGYQINTVVRYAIQIATTIGSTGDSELEFVAINIEKESNTTRTLLISTENKGDRLLKAEVSVEIFDTNGVSVGVFEARRKRIYPGTSVTYRVSIPVLPAGKYNALLLADCFEEDTFGVNLVLNFKDE